MALTHRKIKSTATVAIQVPALAIVRVAAGSPAGN
jgi:hypothetical protein